MSTVIESNQTSPRPVTVAHTLWAVPTAIPSAIGVSMCKRRGSRAFAARRSDCHARWKKGAAPYTTAGTASTRLIQRAAVARPGLLVASRPE